MFQGWERPLSLLPLLLDSDQKYLEYYQNAFSAANQVALLPPLSANEPLPPWLQLWAQFGANLAFSEDGKPNQLVMAQLLQHLLGNNIERELNDQGKDQRMVTITRLSELFVSVLSTEIIDEEWKPEQQSKAFFATKAAYVTLTRHGEFLALVPRTAILEAVVHSLVSESADS